MRIALFVLVGLAACYPTTTRPDITPLPDASRIEVEMTVAQATRALAVELHTDSFPVMRTEPEDGWLETFWFNGVSMQPTGQRLLGIDMVKLRAFVSPGRSNHSVITVELVYRPMANPALPPRELEVLAEPHMPIAGRLQKVLERLGSH